MELLCWVGDRLYAMFTLGGLLPLQKCGSGRLHHLLFETLPGFVVESAVVSCSGGLCFCWLMVFGSYYIWMHNSVLRNNEE